MKWDPQQKIAVFNLIESLAKNSILTNKGILLDFIYSNADTSLLLRRSAGTMTIIAIF
jgi:hypothetical protein